MVKDIEINKLLTKRTYQEETISEWFTVKGYTLKFCALSNKLFTKALLNVVYGTFEEFRQYVKETHNYDVGEENPIAMYVWVNDKERGKQFKYLLIQEMEWTPQCYGTMCHELHHYTHVFLDEVGVKHSMDCEEVFAYFQGHFMELLVRAFMELHKTKKLRTQAQNKKK